MKKVIYRVLSFLIDMAIVNIIIFLLTSISFINPNKNEISKNYSSYLKVNQEYQAITNNIDEYLKDKKFDEKEIKSIKKESSTFLKAINDYTQKEELTDKDITKVKDKINDKNLEISSDYIYKINKLNVSQVIVSAVIYILYFGLFAYFNNSQTIGKKIFKMRVINNKDEKNSISIFSYIIRGILVSEILFSLIDLLLVFTMKKGSYITANYWISEAKMIYELVFIGFIMLRNDNRGLHDLILNTRVSRFDKDNNEIIETFFNEEEKKEETNKKETGKKRKKNVK